MFEEWDVDETEEVKKIVEWVREFNPKYRGEVRQNLVEGNEDFVIKLSEKGTRTATSNKND